MKNEDFAITEEKTAECAKFLINGRVNSINADELQYTLTKALSEGYTNIVLNMMRVGYLSSAGIRVILKTYKDAKTAGGKFRIEMPSENVKNVLGMTALDDMLIQ